MITLIRSQKSKDIPLQKAKAHWNAQIAKITEVARTAELTSVFGQEMMYQEKAKQAHNFLDQEIEPNESDPGYEYIFGEVGVTAGTAKAVAEIIVDKSSQYKLGLGPAVERLRLIANKAVKAASTYEEMQECVDEFEQDLELL
jgi:hypothetical protein